MRSRAADTERVIPQFWEGIGHQTEAILRQLTAQGSDNMPDIVAHNAHGKQVLSHLKPEIVSLIDRGMFQSGLMGPDPFIFYRFFAPHFRHGINKRGKLMHTSGADEFLLALAKQSKKELFETKDIRCFSFMCGFLCHFSLDSIVHPYIELLEAGNKGMHTAIEHRIEMMILERDGKQPRDIIGVLAQYKEVPGVKAAFKEVYNWDDDCFEASYRHMKYYYSVVKDQSGWIERIFHNKSGRLSTLSYRTKKANTLDLSWYDKAETDATADAVRLITSARHYCDGLVGEKELLGLIGKRTYMG